MESNFKAKQERLQEEFAKELNDATEIMKAQHKRELGKTIIIPRNEKVAVIIFFFQRINGNSWFMRKKKHFNPWRPDTEGNLRTLKPV